jgi:hypothetical protein
MEFFSDITVFERGSRYMHWRQQMLASQTRSMEDDMNTKQIGLVLLVSVLLLFAAFPVWAQNSGTDCHPVGGVLMTNINAIAGQTNLGPVFGDLSGSVAATILGQNSDGSYNVQHYWVTAAGDTIKFQQAVLHPTYPVPSDQNIVAVPWGNYRANIEPGGTGKFTNATGYTDYSGMADFHTEGLGALTLVLRYSGQVCYNDKQ